MKKRLFFAMQKHSKIRNVPFPRPYGATGNDAPKLHAPAFAHFRGAVLMHEALCRKRTRLLFCGGQSIMTGLASYGKRRQRFQ